MKAVNAGARLDRLPVARFHYRTIGLIGGGMFLDAFEIYLQGSVLAVLLASGWSTPAQNALFVSATFAGMVLGAWLSGILGDRFGRRFPTRRTWRYSAWPRWPPQPRRRWSG